MCVIAFSSSQNWRNFSLCFWLGVCFSSFNRNFAIWLFFFFRFRIVFFFFLNQNLYILTLSKDSPTLFISSSSIVWRLLSFPPIRVPTSVFFFHTLSITRCYLQMCLDLVLVLAAAARRRLTALSPFFLNQIIYLVWGIFIVWHWIWFFLQGSSGVFCVVLIIEKI